ncbi:hypothetical protein KQI65_02745 [bacterium]|nr:hypothetical protein [bacterium]
MRFQRTLRIPDDGKKYPLPPGLGAFPLYRVEDYTDRIPAHWQRENAFFLPMYRREAMWIEFDAAAWKPNAVQVGLGRIDALTGNTWDHGLQDDPQNYLVVPNQPWLDGIKTEDGVIRQFVAVAKGSGYSVEAQVTGAESEEALRIAVYEPRPGRFPESAPFAYDRGRVQEVDAPAMAASARGGVRKSSLGMGAGGRMKQKVYPDAYGLRTWEKEAAVEIVLYIVDSEYFAAITGMTPPSTPIDAETYTTYGYPWFALYDERKPDIPAGETLGNVRSTGELDEERGGTPDSSLQIPDSLIITLPVHPPNRPEPQPIEQYPPRKMKPKEDPR